MMFAAAKNQYSKANSLKGSYYLSSMLMHVSEWSQNPNLRNILLARGAHVGAIEKLSTVFNGEQTPVMHQNYEGLTPPFAVKAREEVSVWF